MSLRLRPRAEADLAEIWRYTAKRWSRDQADNYFRTLLDALNAIAATPELGRPCDEIRPGYRRRNVGAHVIFFRLEQAGDVDVVRVLHSRRDFRRHLPRG